MWFFLEIYQYHCTIFKTDQVSLRASFVYFLSSHKNLKRLCYFCFSDFWMTWCDCIGGPSLQNQCKHVPVTFLWPKQYIYTLHFQPTTSIDWTIVFVSAITCYYRSFAFFGDSFIMSFNYLAYLFYITIAHINRIVVKYLCWFWDVIVQ